MKNRKLNNVIAVTLLTSGFVFSGSVMAAGGEDASKTETKVLDMNREQNRDRLRDQDQDQQVYGSQLMTEEELKEHRAKMRAAKTMEEREQIKKKNHELMQERAKKLGLTLPQ